MQLQFVSTKSPAPAAQTHALYPSADAYFEFSCPYGDCDGSLDLNESVLSLLRHSRKHGDGSILCPGSRTAGGTTRLPCNQRVDYWIRVQYQAIARASG